MLILLFDPVSGAHFNPVVSLAKWALGRRTGEGLSIADVAAYAVAQTTGGIAGAVLANVMFDVDTAIATKHRASGGHLVAEVAATAVLVALIFALVRSDRGAIAAPRSGPTSARRTGSPAPLRSPTRPSRLPDLLRHLCRNPPPPRLAIAMQFIGLIVGIGMTLALYPDAGAKADDVVAPHAH